LKLKISSIEVIIELIGSDVEHFCAWSHFKFLVSNFLFMMLNYILMVFYWEHKGFTVALYLS